MVRVTFAIPAQPAQLVIEYSVQLGQQYLRGEAGLTQRKVEDILTVMLNLALLKEYGKWKK